MISNNVASTTKPGISMRFTREWNIEPDAKVNRIDWYLVPWWEFLAVGYGFGRVVPATWRNE